MSSSSRCKPEITHISVWMYHLCPAHLILFDLDRVSPDVSPQICKAVLLTKLFCRSTDYGDELTWAAAWLYKATDDPQFLDEAEHHYMKFRLKERPNEFFYNKKVAGVQVCDQYVRHLF